MNYQKAWTQLKQDLVNILKLGENSGYTNDNYDFEFPKGCYHAYQHIYETMQELENFNEVNS